MIRTVAAAVGEEVVVDTAAAGEDRTAPGVGFVPVEAAAVDVAAGPELEREQAQGMQLVMTHS